MGDKPIIQACTALLSVLTVSRAVNQPRVVGELTAEHIRINAVAPGIVPTPLYGELSDEQRDSLHGMQPLGRYDTPKDVADAVLYLANATWVTAEILPVDGGVDAGGDCVYHGADAATSSAGA